MGETSTLAPGAGGCGHLGGTARGINISKHQGQRGDTKLIFLFYWLGAIDEGEAARFPLKNPKNQFHDALISLSFICSSVT